MIYFGNFLRVISSQLSRFIKYYFELHTHIGRGGQQDGLKMDIVAFHMGRLEGRSQVVEQELVRLGEQRVQTSEGTRAIALELCREFEDRFLQHIQTGEVSMLRTICI